MTRFALGLVVLIVAVSGVRAEEKPLEMSLGSLAMFKSGLAFVEYVGQMPGDGTYRVEGLPDAVHGTFWIESDAQVVVRMAERPVDVPLAQLSPAEFQKNLAGRRVTIRFSEPHLETISGRIVGSETKKTWNRDYEQPRQPWFGSLYRQPTTTTGWAINEAMLALETADGMTYLKTSSIAAIDVPGGIQSVQSELPVMLLDVSGSRQPAKIVIRSLVKGVAWAPSYQIDVSDDKTLVLRQKAVVKNELMPIKNAEMRLISGFPSIHFANVNSPMSTRTSWSGFFQQLNNVASGKSSSSSMMPLQAPMYSNFRAPESAIDLSAIPSGEGADLYFHSIGRRTLDPGDSLTLETASGKAKYERIVEWIVPDTRDVNGRAITTSNSKNKKADDMPWDALRFRNPLEFPMTTAPAMMVANGRFLGQQPSYWVNVGEQTTLRVTKALSVRTRSTEHEIEGSREEHYAYGRRYRKAEVEASVLANNHRNERVKLVIRKRFSGELISAEGNPQKTLRQDGIWSINQRNELIWTVELDPGEEIHYQYTYSVLTS